ncbi:hypothetical protein DL96DRAFT_1703538 [Flagelloscypha sp. PMI_526]|nr:hypothetical protein DL96DRAFT_1703538 [Flagelloscypha sp. PMI_526]
MSDDGNQTRFGESLGDFLSLYPSQFVPNSQEDFPLFSHFGVSQYGQPATAPPWVPVAGQSNDNMHHPRRIFRRPHDNNFAIGSSSSLPDLTALRDGPTNPIQSDPSEQNYPSPSTDSHEEPSEFEPLPPLPVEASSEERAQWLRKKNALSARKNRKLKAMKAQRLEEQVVRLQLEKEKWKTRAETLRQLLTSNGIPCPRWND